MFGGHQFAGNRVTDNEIDFIGHQRAFIDQSVDQRRRHAELRMIPSASASAATEAKARASS